MLEINQKLLKELLANASASERKRVNYDLRTSTEEGSQRMLNVLMPGTKVCVHRHPLSNENVLCLTGKLDEILYEVRPTGLTGLGTELVEIERVHLCPSEGRYGCVIPAGAWHTVEVYEPSVIHEAKDGKYGQDGSENL